MANLSKNNYTLGRGELYIAPFANKNARTLADGGGYRFIGNVPTFTININATTLDHYQSTGGVKVKDFSIATQIDYSATITAEDISVPNLAMSFLGSYGDYTRAAQVGLTETIKGAVPGRRYFLGISDENPSGYGNIENVVIKDLTAGIDFFFDPVSGGIEFEIGGKVTSAGMDVDVTYDLKATTSSRAISGSEQVEGAIKYISHNAAGRDMIYTMPYCTISPNGDFNLIADTLQQLSFKVGIQALGNRAALYADGEAVNV